ncbi:MAG TPA: radical SAM family heme chaperone HemW [Cyclobacteriaceae bacterium]|nr:radical SAM family heme chaperone HemW [Cyclobacteriaceae bacterium]
MAGIYIHIPFCKQACHYCDFHFSTNQETRKEFIQSVVREVKIQQDYLMGEVIQTVYFGGGTPSMLEARELELVLEAIRSSQQVMEGAEITLEANPDDLSLSKLKELSLLGINRLSIGIQSFHAEILTFLNRAHDANTAIISFQHAREIGFKNISIDLIYGMPNETEDQWKEDIRRAISLQPDHISCYALTIEPKTVFGKWSATGKLKPADDETAARHLEILMDELEQAGFEHYEISNFAKPGFQSRHNSSYWKQEKYLGVGPSAHSYNGSSRQFNIRNNNLYIRSLKNDVIPFEREELSQEDLINEFILTTLRTNWGTDLKKIKQDFGYDLLNKNTDYLSKIFNSELAVLENGVLRLTRKGKLLADKISSDLFVVNE